VLCKGEGVDVAHDFEAIWREQGPAIWRAILAYAGGRRDVADDAVAEAFARVMERGSTIRDANAYLYRVAFRIAAADLRTRSPEVEDHVVTDPEPLVDLLSAIRALTPAQRAAVYLHYRADMTVREIARVMDTSSAAVKVNLMRGRRRLAELLEDDT
jgi:RNA polymerase sigma-70 factor (ECF subfamily)